MMVPTERGGFAMTAKMKNTLVGSVGLFAIAMAFTLFAIPQASYADQAVDESDDLAAADEARYDWVRDESGTAAQPNHATSARIAVKPTYR